LRFIPLTAFFSVSPKETLNEWLRGRIAACAVLLSALIAEGIDALQGFHYDTARSIDEIMARHLSTA